MPRRWVCCPISALFIALQLLLCKPVAALTKEAVQAVYENKFRYLESWRLEYSDDGTEVRGNESIDTFDLVEFYAKGDKKADIKSRLDTTTDTVKPSFTEMYSGNGKPAKRLHYGKKMNEGYVYRVGEEQLHTWVATTPLGYAGLHNTRWDGSGEPVSGTPSCDMTVLMRVPYSTVAAEPVVLDGRECYLVEATIPGTDGLSEPWGKWWLAPELGLAVVRYEGYQGDLSLGRFLRMQVVFNDFTEVAPSFFMPHAIQLELFDPVEEDGTKKVKKRLSRQFRLTSIELNPEIADSEFELIFPPGTVVHDELADRIYLMPSADLTMGSSLTEDLEQIASRMREDTEALDPSLLVTAIPNTSQPDTTGGVNTGPTGRQPSKLLITLACALSFTAVAVLGRGLYYYAHRLKSKARSAR